MTGTLTADLLLDSDRSAQRCAAALNQLTMRRVRGEVGAREYLRAVRDALNIAATEHGRLLARLEIEG